MKSHDFAKQLSVMAKVLRAGPNVELETMQVGDYFSPSINPAPVETKDIPKVLNLLVGINNVPKQEWIALIHAFSFNIEIRPRDANRDILGKLLKYLSENPAERKRLIDSKGRGAASVSNELADALTLILK